MQMLHVHHMLGVNSGESRTEVFGAICQRNNISAGVLKIHGTVAMASRTLGKLAVKYVQE